MQRAGPRRPSPPLPPPPAAAAASEPLLIYTKRLLASECTADLPRALHAMYVDHIHIYIVQNVVVVLLPRSHRFHVYCNGNNNWRTHKRYNEAFYHDLRGRASLQEMVY